MKRNVISLLLAAAVLSVLLAGCGEKQAKVEVTETPAPQESAAPVETPAAPEASAQPEETPDPEAEARRARYDAAFRTHTPDETVLLVNDTPISWQDYYSWLYDIASQMEQRYEVTDWNEPRDELAGIVPDSTFGSYVRKTALGYVVQVAVIQQKAQEMGVTMTDEQKAELDATMQGYYERFGGQEAFEELLAQSYLTTDYFRRQNESMALINNIYAEMYGEKGEKLSEEDAIAYVKDNGYLYAKHILFKTVDDDRQPLDEATQAEKKAEAEEVLRQLRECTPEELPERFDALMRQYSEDTGMLSYPDGYYFHAGEMVPAFEQTVRSLEENGLSDLVESDYGYHIIFCPPMRSEHTMGYDANYQPYGAKALASAALFDTIAQEWFEEAERKVVYVNDFDALDLNELLNR